MIKFLQRLFNDDFIVDDREPFVTFQIASIEGEFSLFAPKAEPWKLLVLFNLLQTVIQIVFACVIYYGIVKRRGTIGSYFIGWGFIIPISLYLPFYLVDTLDLRNKMLCLGSSTASSVIFFRCIEAMYGTSPDFVELSISNYCSYYGSLATYVWNEKTKQRESITRMRLSRSLMERLFNFAALSLVLSILSHYDFKPFEDTVDFTSRDISQDLLSLGNLSNSYLLILLFYFTLNNLFELNAFGENVKGFVTEPIFHSPLTHSKTPTEFWTKRWNHMTHRLLKGGIFEPAKLCFGDKKFAMFLTFVASGLYHEYVWTTMFYNQKYRYDENDACTNEENCYEFNFGRVTAFFAYAGIIMHFERPVRKLAFVKWLSSHLPTLMVAQMLVCIHAPLVKLYGGDWVKGGFFDDLSIATFTLRKNS